MKVDDPDRAVHTLAAVMKTFDQPRGITVDRSDAGEDDALTTRLGLGNGDLSSEYTKWRKLTDLERGQLFVRSYEALNATMFDLGALAAHDTVMTMPLSAVNGMAEDTTGTLVATSAP